MVVDRQLPYRLLLLDWDGTVRDSIGSIVGCAMVALERAGLDGDEKIVRATVGLDIAESIRRWAPGANAAQLEVVSAAYRELWINDWHARSELFPGMVDCLTDLHARGYWLAIATGKSRVGLERDLATLTDPVRELFVASRTADETQSKPSPAMVFSLLDELGATAEQALVVGDSSHDLQMARNAECHAVGVLCGAADEAELSGCQPQCVLPNLLEVAAWLAEQE